MRTAVVAFDEYYNHFMFRIFMPENYFKFVLKERYHKL